MIPIEAMSRARAGWPTMTEMHVQPRGSNAGSQQAVEALERPVGGCTDDNIADLLRSASDWTDN